MFAGPLFSREALTLPRQLRHYLLRSGYVAALFILMYTAGQVAFGWQQIRNIGDVSRFGSLVFQIFSLLQLSLVLFFALLFAAGRVAQEKDGRTLAPLPTRDARSFRLARTIRFRRLSRLMVNTLVGFVGRRDPIDRFAPERDNRSHGSIPVRPW